MADVELPPGWFARDVGRATAQVSSWSNNASERRAVYLLERIAGGVATEHDVAELAVLRHRQTKQEFNRA